MKFFCKFKNTLSFKKPNSRPISYAYPERDEALLNAYGGRYEACFIILNNFFQTDNEDFWQDYEDSDFDEYSKDVKFIKWQDVIDQTEIKDINHLHHILVSYYHSLKKKYCDVKGLNWFKEYVQSIEHFRYIGEDFFDDFHRSKYISIFKNLGREVIIIPEFSDGKLDTSNDGVKKIPYLAIKKAGEVDYSRSTPCRMNLESLENNFFMDRGTVMSDDFELLLTVGYDNMFTLLYGSMNQIEDIVKQYQFEGFYADNKTMDDWYTESDSWKWWWSVKVNSVDKYLRIKRMFTLGLK